MQKNTAVLKNWQIRHNFNAKEEWHYLSGDIYSDSRGKFQDGQSVLTSPVIKIDFLNMTAETENTVYKLQGSKSA